MNQKATFSTLFLGTYDSSGTAEPVERFWASMFAGFYSQNDSQPGCAAVRGILQGKSTIPRRLISYYRDPDCPRCPKKLHQDLTALADCCFVGAACREALRNCLATYLQLIPQADCLDILNYLPGDNLIRLWTCLTWHALCGDCYG